MVEECAARRTRDGLRGMVWPGTITTAHVLHPWEVTIMFPWLWFWAPHIHFPWSGSVAQQIDPNLGWFFGAIQPSSG